MFSGLLIFVMCWIITCSFGMIILLLMRVERHLENMTELVNTVSQQEDNVVLANNVN